MKCQSCDSVYINGIFCHESGCPDAWKDKKIKCFDCGFDFIPQERYQTVCIDCQEAQAYNDDIVTEEESE
jgi:hypothetical protein